MLNSTARLRASALALAFVLLAAAAPAQAEAATTRPDEPIVITGAEATRLLGAAPATVVAYRWSGRWGQVPVQVDERAVFNVGSAYGNSSFANSKFPVPALMYADASTFVGPDPDPTLDGNDEIALMARDGGAKALGSNEPGPVVSGSGVELLVSNPLDKAADSYLYLFRSRGGTDQSAGRDYVDYRFNLLSGDYRTTYKRNDGPNPEDSRVTTRYYGHHFADRWISDEIKVTTPGASGVDILDRHKFAFAPGDCGRSEDTFTDGEGAFVVNRDGPIRAIRSYVGANSGPFTQRTHIFYERREDIITNLRVHPIPGGTDFFDYSPAAAGMTYSNPLNRAGLLIDGVPESAALGPILWESVSGPQGGLSIVHNVVTDIPNLMLSSYRLDDNTPSTASNNPEFQCTGDQFAIGASGPRLSSAIPDTDPREGPASSLETRRHLFFEKPGAGAERAEARLGEIFGPLRVRGLARERVAAKVFKAKRRGVGLSLKGSACPAGRGTPARLQRRGKKGNFGTVKTLKLRKAKKANCRLFGPVRIPKPGAYRVVVSADELQAGGISRTLKVRGGGG